MVFDEIECADDYRYDEQLNQCLPKSDVEFCRNFERNLCQGLANGLHLDPLTANCQHYIKCSDGEFVYREKCLSETVFNGVLCVPAPLYDCPTKHNDICKFKPSGGLTSDPRKDNGCNSYVQCNHFGKTVAEKKCSLDQYFDPNESRCVYGVNSQNRKCHTTRPAAKCEQLETGYYQDASIASACHRYYFCYNGNRTDFYCAVGKIFDGENCVNSSAYVCPVYNANSCELKSDGYYKDEMAGCRGYFYCAQGRKYRYLCAENEVFNGTACMQRETGQVCQDMNVCVDKSDGYYFDIQSNCRKYFYCLNHEIVTTLSCRGSKIFNGQKCVPADMFKCPIENMNADYDCIPREKFEDKCSKSGFQADIDSGCVKYHFCIGDSINELFCKDGTVFNGEICVPKSLYTCPKYCTDVIL